MRPGEAAGLILIGIVAIFCIAMTVGAILLIGAQ